MRGEPLPSLPITATQPALTLQPIPYTIHRINQPTNQPPSPPSHHQQLTLQVKVVRRELGRQRVVHPVHHEAHLLLLSVGWSVRWWVRKLGRTRIVFFKKEKGIKKGGSSDKEKHETDTTSRIRREDSTPRTSSSGASIFLTCRYRSIT